MLIMYPHPSPQILSRYNNLVGVDDIRTLSAYLGGLFQNVFDNLQYKPLDSSHEYDHLHFGFLSHVCILQCPPEGPHNGDIVCLIGKKKITS